MRSRLKQIVHIGPPFFVTETEHQYCFNLFSLIETTPIYVGLWAEPNFSFTHLGYGECPLLCLLHSIPPPLMARVCAHIFLDANQEFTATAPDPAEGRSASAGAVLVLGYSVFAFSKAAPLTGLYESPHSMITAHRLFSCIHHSPLDERSVSSPYNSLE